ncbi:MAG: hypothetical protein CVU11_15330 [Bacteroidetes bacterium HGW-Bacteroidetes-6]|jgi:regulator of cell morphogenesis and NO signaling|nr:MAG: hypothetical protein CVU11_15330 [Bacteroidetes bacterium HGW-Bacteroidetes-6]
MTVFEKEMTLFSVVSANNKLLPVLNRFGIYMGLGDATIEQTCRDHGINVSFFMEIINTFSDENYFPENQLIEFDLSLIIQYLKQTHFYYFDFVLPDFEEQLEKISESNKNESNDFSVLNLFYRKYKSEITDHLSDEDKNVFPYVTDIQNVFNKNMSVQSFKSKYVNRSIGDFEKEHSDIETKLNDLKNIIIKYLPSGYNPNLCNKFLYSLMRFEADLKNHARIEDKILIPKVIELEAKMDKIHEDQ